MTPGARDDFAASPHFGLFFAAFYVAGGLVLLYGLTSVGKGWWLIPVMAGFPLFAPFSAVGLYAVSRQREMGERPGWGKVLRALMGHGDDQLLTMGGIIFVAFSFWMILAHGVFAIFMGESGIGVDGSGLTLSFQAAAMILVGISSLSFAVPSLVRSISFPVTNWRKALALAMLPMFMGLFVVLPVLGHATWHLYRRAVSID